MITNSPLVNKISEDILNGRYVGLFLREGYLSRFYRDVFSPHAQYPKLYIIGVNPNIYSDVFRTSGLTFESIYFHNHLSVEQEDYIRTRLRTTKPNVELKFEVIDDQDII